MNYCLYFYKGKLKKKSFDIDTNLLQFIEEEKTECILICLNESIYLPSINLIDHVYINGVIYTKRG